MLRTASLAVLAAVVLATTGCAGGISQWIVAQRDHQGDLALGRGNFADASSAYQLALKLRPADPHARTGLVTVQVKLAQQAFAASKFEDAIAALELSAKYAPGDERVASLRADIEQAQIKREIVISNYPSFRVTGTVLRRGYTNLKAQQAEIEKALKRFDYTYDTTNLTQAIRLSYALDEEVARLTNRLVQYRQLVESGVPDKSGETLAPPASLLPLP